MASTQRPSLPDTLYYLNHFRHLMASVQARCGSLLSAEERQFIGSFAALPEPSAALLVRMTMRRGPLFRSSRLRYPEIGDIAYAAAPMLDNGWLKEPSLDMAALHGLLTKRELAEHLALSADECRLSKPKLLELLRDRHPDSRPFHGWCPTSADRVFHPVIRPLAERFRLLFFGNFRQDLTDLVLVDLKIMAHEPMAEFLSPLFRTREQIEVFLALYGCRQELDEGGDLRKILATMPGPIADCDWLEEIRQSLLFRAATAYERLDADAALTVLATCRHRGARMRSARLLERRQAWQAAHDVCVAAGAHPESDAERQHLRRLLPRLNRRLGFAVAKPTPPPALATLHIALDHPPHDLPLECCVRDHLQAEPHTTVHYVENGLINSLFGLLCWDAVFAPVPGAFFHEFQQGPADLERREFRERRRERFAECFAALDSGRHHRIIRTRFAEKTGIQSPFVAWGLLNERLLGLALDCFPPTHLRLWFEWILRDVVDNRAGFPDLVQFWPDERRYRMVEVKGPKDRVQDNQRRFLEYCTAHGMPVAVCWVTYPPGLSPSL